MSLKASREPVLMTKQMKKDYLEDWKESNKDMLEHAGLGKPDLWDQEPIFCGGVFLSMSFSKRVVPFLQDVYQADAAHCNFGKYTLYSCYGTTANCNTAPIAFAILFGNEDRVGWDAFWKFALAQHPTLNSEVKTVITDQAKG